MVHYKIDDEFAALLPPLTDEETAALHESIENDGEITDPVIIWDGHDIVVDGMNRYQYHLVTGHKVTFKKMKFESRDEVKKWMISRQLGRRNCEGMARAQLRRLLVGYVAKKNPAPEPKPSSPKRAATSTNQAVKQVAQALNVSERQVFRDVKIGNILEDLPSGVRKKIVDGAIGSSAESLKRLDNLPGHQRQQVVDLISVIDPSSEQQTFRHVDEIIEAVVDNEKSNKPIDSTKPVKKIEDIRKKIEKLIENVPSLLDEFASLNGLTGDSWRDRSQAAIKNFVTIWREKCKKMNS